VHQGLADTILNAMQRFDVETLRQARKQLAQSACHFIKRAGGRPDDLGMSACRQQQKGNNESGDAAKRDLDDAIERRSERSHESWWGSAAR
jgi:hypothetical protein